MAHRYLAAQAGGGWYDERDRSTHPKFDVLVLEVALRLGASDTGAMDHARRTTIDTRGGPDRRRVEPVASPIGVDPVPETREHQRSRSRPTSSPDVGGGLPDGSNMMQAWRVFKDYLTSFSTPFRGVDTKACAPGPFEYERTSVDHAIGLLDRLGSGARSPAGAQPAADEMKLVTPTRVPRGHQRPGPRTRLSWSAESTIPTWLWR